MFGYDDHSYSSISNSVSSSGPTTPTNYYDHINFNNMDNSYNNRNTTTNSCQGGGDARSHDNFLHLFSNYRLPEGQGQGQANLNNNFPHWSNSIFSDRSSSTSTTTSASSSSSSISSGNSSPRSPSNSSSSSSGFSSPCAGDNDSYACSSSPGSSMSMASSSASSSSGASDRSTDHSPVEHQCARRRNDNGRQQVFSTVPMPTSPPTNIMKRATKPPVSHTDRQVLRMVRLHLQTLPIIKNKNICCKFCKTNGEPYRIYATHTLNDKEGHVVCPLLQRYTCTLCGATGRVAHTVKYCPQNTFDFLRDSMDMELYGNNLL